MNRQTHFTSWPGQIWMQVGMWGKNAAEHCNSLFLFHQCSAQVSSKRKLSFYCFISAPQTLEYNISRYFCTAIKIYPTQNDVSDFWYCSDLFFNLFLLQKPMLKSKVILFNLFLIFNSHTESFNTVIISLKSPFLISPCETSLVVQWLRLHACTEELQVWSLVGNKNTACLAAKKKKKNSPCDITVVKDGILLLNRILRYYITGDLRLHSVHELADSWYLIFYESLPEHVVIFGTCIRQV